MTQMFKISNELTFELCCCSSGIQSSKMVNCCTSSRIAIKLHKYQACYFLKKFFASQVQSFLQTNFILYYFDQAIKQYNLSILYPFSDFKPLYDIQTLAAKKNLAILSNFYRSPPQPTQPKLLGNSFGWSIRSSSVKHLQSRTRRPGEYTILRSLFKNKTFMLDEMT